jgi:F-box-like
MDFLADRLDDVLLVEIFLNLDYEDLVNCEKVCKRWRNILKARAWKTCFNKKVIRMNGP